MYTDKESLGEPVKVKKLGTIIRKGGEWYNNHTECDAHDTIEGYVLVETHNMLKESQENLKIENIELRNKINSKQEETPPTEEEESKDYLNLLTDIKRVDSVIRRLDRRGKKSKSDDVMAKCAGVMAILEGKKLLLIQAVTHTEKKLRHDKRYNT